MVGEPEAILGCLTCRGVVLWCWTEISSVCSSVCGGTSPPTDGSGASEAPGTPEGCTSPRADEYSGRSGGSERLPQASEVPQVS